PDIVGDGTVETGTGEVAGRFVAMLRDEEVVWGRAIFAGSQEAEALGIRSDSNAAKWTARRQHLGKGTVSEPKEKDALGVLVGFGMVCCDHDETRSGWMPGEFRDRPSGLGESFGFAGSKRQEPEAGALVVFVDEASVVFVFFLLFFSFGFGVGREEGDLF